MLDRFRRGQNKQTTIKLYLRFVSPTLLARGRDPLSARRFRRKKYSVSTRMDYVQTKLMNCYSPVPPSCPRPFQSPFDCCISSPLSTPILLRIKHLVLVLYKSNVYNHQNAIGTNQWHLDDRCSRANMIQSAPLAGNIRYLPAPRPYRKEDTTVERVGHGQRRLGRRRSPRLWRLLWRRHYNVVPKQR